MKDTKDHRMARPCTLCGGRETILAKHLGRTLRMCRGCRERKHGKLEWEPCGCGGQMERVDDDDPPRLRCTQCGDTVVEGGP